MRKLFFPYPLIEISLYLISIPEYTIEIISYDKLE